MPLRRGQAEGYTADRGGHHRPSRGDPAGERSGVRSDSHQGEAPQRVAGDAEPHRRARRAHQGVSSRRDAELRGVGWDTVRECCEASAAHGGGGGRHRPCWDQPTCIGVLVLVHHAPRPLRLVGRRQVHHRHLDPCLRAPSGGSRRGGTCDDPSDCRWVGWRRLDRVRAARGADQQRPHPRGGVRCLAIFRVGAAGGLLGLVFRMDG
mmetsp:Transcript_8406/g.19435  ORF Transcript_8406/g.19435 Transcript_8406/m.19435 type:complete len:207 (+) Transcript_8406:2396-3016(+)